MKAFNDCVIIEPETVEGREKKTATGILISEKPTNREGSRVFLAFGKVLDSAVEGVKRGQTIGYNPYDAFEFKRDEQTYEGVPKVAIRVVI